MTGKKEGNKGRFLVTGRIINGQVAVQSFGYWNFGARERERMAGNHRTGLIALRGVLSTMELCLVCPTPLSKSNFRSMRGDIKDFHTQGSDANRPSTTSGDEGSLLI